MIKYHIIELYYEIKRTTITIVDNTIFMSKQFITWQNRRTVQSCVFDLLCQSKKALLSGIRRTFRYLTENVTKINAGM